MLNIKNDVLSLLDLYYKEETKKSECVDRLYILIYYHRTSFGLFIKEDEASDFLATLYPAGIESLFNRYDKSKSNFYTFVCACLKYKCDFFLQNNSKQKNKLTVLMEQVKRDALLENELSENTFLENELLECCFFKNNIQNYQNDKTCKLSVKEEHELGKIANELEGNNKKMKDMLLHWFNNEGKKGNKKGERRLIFILLCKAAMFIDDNMLHKITYYLEIPFEVISYYLDVFRFEFIKCNKEMLEAKARRDKYYVRRLTHMRLLRLENNTEYSKGIINRSLEYSIQRHKKASLEINRKLRSVSNRRISSITGISRSSIDRICGKSELVFEKLGE